VEDACTVMAEATTVSPAAEARVAESGAIPMSKPETKAAAVVFRVFI
jgi:hypothetical protein